MFFLEKVRYDFLEAFLFEQKRNLENLCFCLKHLRTAEQKNNYYGVDF